MNQTARIRRTINSTYSKNRRNLLTSCLDVKVPPVARVTVKRICSRLQEPEQCTTGEDDAEWYPSDEPDGLDEKDEEYWFSAGDKSNVDVVFCPAALIQVGLG
jgi:hypothetical protein